MRGGPDDAPPLAGLGTPSVVVARLDLTGSSWHSATFPSLGTLFVRALLPGERGWADVHHGDPVPGEDILEIWQPGHPEYDHHGELPR